MSPKEWNAIPLGLLVPAAALWGLAVFVADQRRQAHRYFAEHGMNPRLVWLSRQVVGAAPLVAWLVAALLFLALCPQSESGRIRWPPPNMDARFAGEAVCCALLAYAAGQACSMFFRSAILALVGTVFSVIVLVYWVVLMRAAEISWSWSVLPIRRGAAGGDVAASAGLGFGKDQLVGPLAFGFDTCDSGRSSGDSGDSCPHLRDSPGRARI